MLHTQQIRKHDDQPFVPVLLVPDVADGAAFDPASELARFRTLAWRKLTFNALLVVPEVGPQYAFLQHGVDAAVLAALDAWSAEERRPGLTERLLIYGFGDGAQFAHRFTLKHPRRVMGCVALAAGSWTDPSGFCAGELVHVNAFGEPPLDTDAVRTARKAKCTEPTALPGVRWRVGAPSEATPETLKSTEMFRQDLARAGSTVAAMDWTGPADRATTLQFVEVFDFFNDVAAHPAALPDPPAAPVAAEPEVTADADAPAPTPAESDADPEPAVGPEPAPSAATDDPEPDDAADDDGPPAGNGRGGYVPARERPRPAAEAPAEKKKPGEGNGFFDQLLRQQNK